MVNGTSAFEINEAWSIFLLIASKKQLTVKHTTIKSTLSIAICANCKKDKYLPLSFTTPQPDVHEK